MMGPLRAFLDALQGAMDGDGDELAELRDRVVVLTQERDRAQARASMMEQTARRYRRELDHLHRDGHPATRADRPPREGHSALVGWCDDIAAISGEQPVLEREPDGWRVSAAGFVVERADLLDACSDLFGICCGCSR